MHHASKVNGGVLQGVDHLAHVGVDHDWPLRVGRIGKARFRYVQWHLQRAVVLQALSMHS